MKAKGLTSFKLISGIFLLCALAVALSFLSSVWAEQPRSKTPQDKLKSPDRPKAPSNVIEAEDVAPAAKETSFFSVDEDKPRIHLGALELHPYSSIEERYDTNIYFQPRGQEHEDWITDYSVGFAAKMPLVPQRGDDYLIEGNYHADIIEYANHHKLSRVDHTAHAALTCAFPNDFGVRLSEDFLKTQDPPNDERTLLTKRLWNMADARVNYIREKIKLEGAVTLTADSYNEYHNLNHNDCMGTATAFYNIGPKTWLLGEFNFGRIIYRNSATNSDSDYYQGRVGVEGDIAPKLNGMLKFGYRNQDYSNSTLANDYSGTDVYGNLKYEVTQRTTLNIYGEIRPEESSYGTNSHYQINTAGVKFDHLLSQRLWLNGGAFWALDLYPTESTEGSKTAKRRDVLWGTAVGLKHEVKDWLSLNAGYEFKQRNSNFNNLSYNDHKVLFRVSATF